MKVHFCDFWSDGIFNPPESPLYKIMSTKFDLEIDDHNPDVVFFSCFGGNNIKYNNRAKKILFLGEHWINPAYGADISTYDASLTHLSDTEGKNYYFPLWALFMDWFKEDQPRPSGDPNYFCDLDLFNGGKDRNFRAEGRGYCSLINNRDPEGNRAKIFGHLSKHKKVDSYGGFLNNMGGKRLGGMQFEKCDLLKDYKFNIAFENLQHEGYNTEKIIQPMESGCIPIYWGGNKAKKYFNPDSYIDVDDYESFEAVADRVLEIDEDDSLYEDIVNCKPFIEDPIEFHPEVIADWLCEKLELS